MKLFFSHFLRLIILMTFVSDKKIAPLRGMMPDITVGSKSPVLFYRRVTLKRK